MTILATLHAEIRTVFGFLFVTLLVANIRRWAQEKGHDVWILWFLDVIPRRWLPWCFLLSGALVVWSFLPAAPPDQNISKEVSSPQQPATPATGNKPERPPPAYGGLYPWQITIFMNGLAEMKEDLHSKILIARPQMVEPQGFSRAFENAAHRAGLEPIVLQQNPAGPDQTGVMVAVPDIEAPSPSALKMQTLIKQLGFEGRFVPLLDTSSKQAAPLHANEVGNFAIFIGPSPL